MIKRCLSRCMEKTPKGPNLECFRLWAGGNLWRASLVLVTEPSSLAIAPDIGIKVYFTLQQSKNQYGTAIQTKLNKNNVSLHFFGRFSFTNSMLFFLSDFFCVFTVDIPENVSSHLHGIRVPASSLPCEWTLLLHFPAACRRVLVWWCKVEFYLRR